MIDAETLAKYLYDADFLRFMRFSGQKYDFDNNKQDYIDLANRLINVKKENEEEH